MEVSFQSRLTNFHFRPSPPPRHFCRTEGGLFFSTSLPHQLGPHNEFYIKSPVFKPSLWRSSNTYRVTNLMTFSPKGRTRAFWRTVHLSEKLGRTNSSFILHKRHKLSRYIGVKSDVAGTESAGAAYPLSDLQIVSRIRGILFYVTTSIVAIFLFVLMLAAHPFVLIFDQYRRKVHHLIAKIWAVFTVCPFFAIEFEGLENLPPPDTPAVFVSNHQSFLDIYTLLTLGRSFKFISKTSIFLFPVVGWAMYLLGLIPLKRMDSRSQMDCLRRCIDLVNKGASVFFFPEGTRSKDGKLGAFKKGAFSVAVKTGVPVVPITLIGTGKIMPAGIESRLNTGSVKVVIHRPIEGNVSDELCNEARNVIAESLIREGCKI